MKKINILIFLLLFLLACQFSIAQVGIGTTTPNSSAILDLTSSSKGMLIPRLTLAQKLSIISPATGLMIYQTDGTYGLCYYDGSSWITLITGGDSWKLTGNSGSIAASNFIGTSDSVDLITKTNNIERMRVLSGGNIGIGTTSPGSTLDIKGTLRLSGSTSGYVGLQPAAAAGSTTYTLPSADGTGGQQLTTNGAGLLSWSNQTGTTTNTLSLASNSLTSTVNGVAATSNAVSGVSNTSAANTLSTTVNGITGSTINIINSNATSLAGANLTTTVNGVASTALDLTPAISSTAWSLTGNSGTTAGTNFTGTTDVIDFVTKTNNIERMRVLSGGNIGIGTTSPGSTVDIKGTLRLSGSTSGYVGLQPAAAAGSTTYTLPSTDGTNGQVLKTNGSGVLSWTSIATIVTLGSDVTNNNATANTIADVTGLSFSVTAGVTYRFHATIIYTAAVITTGSRWSISGPAAPTLLAYNARYPNSSAGETVYYSVAYDQPAGANTVSPFTAGNIAQIEGIIIPSANGTVIVRFASEVGSSAIIAKAGSTLTWW